MDNVITAWGLGAFVVTAICWRLFIQTTRAAPKEYALLEHMFVKRAYWVIGFFICVALGGLWPVSVPCYLLALLLLRKREDVPPP